MRAAVSFWLFALSGLGPTSTAAQIRPDASGSAALGVHVVGVSPLAVGAGVDSVGLRQQVERRLVRAGFRSPTRAELALNPEIPRLVLNVGMFTTRDSSAVYSILLELVELVRIKRNGLETHAVNWSEQMLGMTPVQETGRATRGATAALVDLFLTETRRAGLDAGG